MALDQETINAQLDLLAAHRRALAHLLGQAAAYDGVVLAPPQTAAGIEEARQQIRRIKMGLRQGGVRVEDEPNDEAPPQTEPVQQAGGDVVAGDKVGGDKVMGDKRTINTEGGDYAEGGIDKRQGTFVEGNLYGNVIGQQTNYYQTTAAPLDRQQQRNRRAMLTRVKTNWIDGLLEQSLAKELRIALDLMEQPDALVLPLNALVQELKHPPRPLPSSTPIIDVFTQMGGALLILGAPGAGKTTLLLELARDLIARAEQDEDHPIPVVFNLSSWAEKRRPLKEWLVEELNTKYDVPRKLAQAWIDADVVLSLLDGLDEVAIDHRGACVEAINVYRQEHGLVPIAVCSRVADYEALTIKLRLQGAIAVQALTKQQVDDYLERAGSKLTGVRVALHDDAELAEMLYIPLMLSIATLAYAEKAEAEVLAARTMDERRRHLFDAYIEAMFQRRGKETRYPQRQTLHWLGWLACGMIQQAQTEFLVERLQPEWLPTQAVRFQYVLLDRVVGVLVSILFGVLVGVLAGVLRGVLGFALSAGLVIGLGVGLGALFFGGRSGTEILQQPRTVPAIRDGLSGGLVFGLVFGLVGALGAGLSGGLHLGIGAWIASLLVGGLIGGLLGVLTGRPGVFPRKVIVVDRLRWVYRQAWRSATSGMGAGLGVGLIFGLLVVLVGVLVGGLGIGLEDGLLVVLVGILVGGLFLALGVGVVFGLVFALIFALIGGLRSGLLTATSRANEGIVRSARSALIAWLVFGLILGLVNGLIFGLVLGPIIGLIFGLVFGLVGALAGGFSFGGYACLSHLSLRLVLSRNGSLPFRLVPFLDYCAERIFLRRVGGGYIFVHRLLMEHFASLYTEQPEKARRI